DLVGPRSLVVVQDLQDVAPVFLLADEQEALHILSLATRLDHISIRVGANELHRVIERREIALRDDWHPGGTKLLLPERPIVFEAVCIGRATDDKLPLLAE